MSDQGPVLVVANSGRPSFADALSDGGAFAIIDADWENAAAIVKTAWPAAVLVNISEGCDDQLTSLANRIERIEPYTPLIAVGALSAPPPNVIPFAAAESVSIRLAARLTAALRVRTLHATVLRRLAKTDNSDSRQATEDPLRDATAVLVGRGASFPALSVAMGQRMAVVGALSIEAAARHLNIRDIDGVILGEGFSPRIAEAFLTVLSEDSRFRNLPVIVAGSIAGVKSAHELANLEVVRGSPEEIVANAVPLIRQHALEVRLGRTLASLDAGGLLDPRTGLLTSAAFDRDFAKAVSETMARGGGLSAARFAFDGVETRSSLDAARIISRLMRRMDFASLRDDGSIIAAFAETELRKAHVIARRLASVLKHTMFSSDVDRSRIDPQVTLATLKSNDSAEAVLARLHGEGLRREAS